MAADALRSKLSVIEPTEEIYVGLGPADVPVLRELIADQEAWMAARAVFALSRIEDDAAVAALAEAAADRRSEVRVAVAAAVAQRPIALPDAAIERLIEDDDAGVRKFAAFAVKRENGEKSRTLLRRLASDDAVPAVRENAAEASRRLS